MLRDVSTLDLAEDDRWLAVSKDQELLSITQAEVEKCQKGLQNCRHRDILELLWNGMYGFILQMLRSCRTAKLI